ncbi:hypothetical protein [Streptomyces paromomycinus]|uniref:Uncharacterized protein n=1 Tax=Streptomyces paromomycinus TaxID=92743 RepID=A0A401WGE1_STREY|nr:hypothetical protein [Streptomyces paromomycinus]GCD48389.1 hypothetical protein GKJPGBOP_08186 [Streptomyces paromomycinus]
MSDDVLSIIPVDPWWQPEGDAVERVVQLVKKLVPGTDHGADMEIDVWWHDTMALVDCGTNLETISCPWCRAAIDTEWWSDALTDRYDDGFTTLTVDVPCCEETTSLNALDYDWPLGFARFQIAVRNPGRASFSEGELTELADGLGQPLKQIWAHV